MNFDEILNKELTPTDVENLRKLKNSSEWKILKEFIEAHVLRWTYNLLMDENTIDEPAENKLKEVRGFAQGFKVIKKIIESK